ncbi:hypothetical protein [Novosphingobium sp.]|uniref:hypothetical protein n=1 Tax=Novosphingobium sp. TaxID=1874826 RepID=UPI0025D9DF28|nr:hypothetical protein [Novosphingobium sp.]
MERVGLPVYRNWTSLWFDSAALGFEATAVIGLRLTKLASGDADAMNEAQRMVNEKIDAAIELQTMAMTGSLGMTPQGQAHRAVRTLRRKVESNRRRLSGKRV